MSTFSEISLIFDRAILISSALFKSKKILCIFVLDFLDNYKQKSENFLSSFLEHAKIAAPCSANFINIDLPMPLSHPVITATFFVSKFCISY